MANLTKRLRSPATPEGAEAAREALNSVLARYKSKNDMARALGVARNTVSWWFTKGFVGGASAHSVAETLGVPLSEVRPDVNMGETDPDVNMSEVRPDVNA